MIRWIYRFFEKAYDKKIDGIGIAVFRIIFSTVLLFEVVDLYIYRHLIFDSIPYIQPSEIDFSFALFAWMLVLFSLIIGYKTKLTSILNYCFLLVFIATINTYEYHMFYAYMGLGFILMFMPLNCALSLDRLILRIKNSNSRYTYNPDQRVSQLYYFLPIYVGIGLVYIDSVFYKTTSHYWMEGLGMWRPGVLPQFNKFGEHFTLNIEWITRFLGYLTLIFEAIFIFLFWYKPFRIPFLLIGLGLHLGIFIFFPIPLFAFGVSAIYILLIPVGFWRKFRFPKYEKKRKFTFIFDNDCPLCHRTKITIESFDIFHKINFIPVSDAKNKIEYSKELQNIENIELITNIYSVSPTGKIYKGVNTYIQVLIRMIYTFPLAFIILIPGIYHFAKYIYANIAENRERIPCNDENCEIQIPEIVLLSENTKILANFTVKKWKIMVLGMLFISLTSIQGLISYNSGILINLRENLGLKDTKIDQLLEKISNNTNYFSKKLFGITHHPVFMDGHMNNYDHIFAIVYINNGRDEWLPIINKNGQPEEMIYGPRWVKWTFRVNSPYINKANLEKGIRDFSAWWLGYNKIGFENEKFLIMLKQIEVPKTYSNNFLSKQMRKKWIKLGTADWVNKKIIIKLNYDLIENIKNN